MNNKKLANKIKSKEAKIGVIGLGYVGLPLTIRFVEEKFGVIGFDVDEKKIYNLNNGISYFKHIPNKKIEYLVSNGFEATADWSKINICDAIIICVPTPLSDNNEPDLRFIRNTMHSIKHHLRSKQILVLESTTYPGTTEEELVPLVTSLGFTIGEDFFIGFSPEREDPGNKKYKTKNIPKVVSGITQNCLELINFLYISIIDNTVLVSSTRVAEMTKLLENIHRAVNIGLVNELKIVADKMNIDIFEVIDAAATKPFGFTPFYPGPGLGGHCIPIDPFYLTWKAQQYGIHPRFIELAGEVNASMPEWVLGKVSEELEKRGENLHGTKVLILGVAYKKNVDDMRETPAFKLMELLFKKKAQVEYHDPYVPHLSPTRNYDFQMSSIDLSSKKIAEYDIIILVTDHDIFDYDLILNSAKCLVDTRGRYRNNKSVVKA